MMGYKEYMSYELGDGSRGALTLEEWRDTKDIPDNGLLDLQEWVWQYARDRQEAVRQHESKHAEWYDDLEAGRATNKVY